MAVFCTLAQAPLQWGRDVEDSANHQPLDQQLECDVCWVPPKMDRICHDHETNELFERAVSKILVPENERADH